MKLVNESLFEFKKGLDPVDSLFGNINVGDLVTDINLSKGISRHVSSKFIYIVTHVNKYKNSAELTSFLYFFILNGKILPGNLIEIVGGIGNSTYNLNQLRKLNYEEKQLIKDNLKKIKEAIPTFERNINFKDNTNIKINL